MHSFSRLNIIRANISKGLFMSKNNFCTMNSEVAKNDFQRFLQVSF